MNKFISFFSALFISIAAHAAPFAEATNTTNTVRLVLHDTPCTSAMALERVRIDARPFFMHGEYHTSDGKKIIACWRKVDGGVAITDEEGDIGVLPETAFRKLDNI